MKRNEIQWYRGFKLSALLMTGFTALLVGVSPKQAEAVNLGGATHIGTFEGQTTFQTSSSNGINPGLYLEVMDRYGNYKTYTSEDGVITVDGTKEGAYVTQAKLLGKTKYRDVQTGELLDQWEDGRDLKLESVKMPVLTTTGKNLFDGELEDGAYDHLTGNPVDVNGEKRSKYPIRVNGNAKYYFSSDSATENVRYYMYDENMNFIATNIFFAKDGVITTVADTAYVHFRIVESDNVNIQIEHGAQVTSYEPFKSNILTVNEEVELRGVGEVKDELNLLTGELTQRIGEIVLDGSENWGTLQQGRYCIENTLNNINRPYIYSVNFKCDKLKPITYIEEYSGTLGIALYENTNYDFIVRTDIQTIEEFKQWLSNNPTTVQYQLKTESVKTVDLTSTYTFGTVAMRDVYVDGKVKPLLCSVNVPTENLTFVLDPNQEEEKQFIAPTFRLINETPTSVRVSLTAFKQESNVFNDVSPTKYENWSQLNKEQSRDIALALVPLASDNWVTVDETPRYVNNYSASVLGEIKAKSSVDLTFKALHGQAFTEELNPQYRLVFLFDF